jgi:hypothetical protein
MSRNELMKTILKYEKGKWKIDQTRKIYQPKQRKRQIPSDPALSGGR